MSIYISGSMAYDRIMTFPGKFKDHIVADKLHSLSVSFMVDRMEEKFGGCAGNIAYTLALLDEAPLVLSSAGRDFGPYAAHMKALGLPLDGIHQDDELFTALCYITTDLENNQITGFYPGAMTLTSRYGYPKLDNRKDIAIVSPGNMTDMRALPEYYKDKGIRYIYDPGQQLPVLEADDLLKSLQGAYALTTNDYELEMISQKTGKTAAEIQAIPEYCITTYGEKGAAVLGHGEKIDIPVVPVQEVKDPTGAGDAHRGGLLMGLYNGFSMEEACQLGATCSSFAIEHFGTQLHAFTKDQFMERFLSVYKPLSKPLWTDEKYTLES